MRHCYYYIFYLSTAFVKKMNKSNPVPEFSGIALLSLLICLNLFSIVSILELYELLDGTNKSIYIAVGLSIWGVNYFILTKRMEAVYYFHQKASTAKQRNLHLVIFCAYILLSIIMAVMF